MDVFGVVHFIVKLLAVNKNASDKRYDKRIMKNSS